MEHLVEECHVRKHFLVLKRFLLMEDGEFAHTLTTRLFEEVGMLVSVHFFLAILPANLPCVCVCVCVCVLEA